MRLVIVLICLISLLGCKSQGTDYTGIWKDDCSDYFGLQIKPVGDGMYSVSFCGADGCFEPGKWTPNTRIDGDPKYEVKSPTSFIIKHKSGYNSIYNKCTDDPTWIVDEPPVIEPAQLPDCSFVDNSKDEGVIIAWITEVRQTTIFGRGINSQTTTVEPFRPVALIDGSVIKETLGSSIHKGQLFWDVLSPTAKSHELSSVGSFLDRMGDDHCVYFGSFEKDNPPLWALLSSKPIPGIFRSPTPKDTETFYQFNKECITQGDYPEGQEPPCTRPELLAITDINGNGSPEYWATEPYMWDTGLTVWEKENDTLAPLLEVCVGCSD